MGLSQGDPRTGAPSVTQQEIDHGLRALGLDKTSSVIVHSSLSSFGWVEDGAFAVCEALVSVCGTVMVPAGALDETYVPAPPGLVRPDNAAHSVATWQEFDEAVARVVPYSPDLPIDHELGRIPETMRRNFPHRRGAHPLMSYLAVGEHAGRLIEAQRLDWPLGPIEALAALGGDVLLLGVDHTSNTAIHLAEQRLGRSCFWRYAKAHDGVWMELPNVPGDGSGFDAIEPRLRSVTREVRIGGCRARRVAVADVLAVATRMIEADPAALLPNEPDPAPDSRAAAALRQRLARIAKEGNQTEQPPAQRADPR